MLEELIKVKKAKILIVDDGGICLDLLGEFLQSARFQPIHWITCPFVALKLNLSRSPLIIKKTNLAIDSNRVLV